MPNKSGLAERTEPPDLGRVHPFTNFQWYLTAARNSVYFAAFSRSRISRDEFRDFVGQLLTLAPQLNWRNDDRGQRHIDLSPVASNDVGSYHEVESFDGFPDRVLGPNTDVFADPALPSFRAECYALNTGETTEGNRSFVIMRASHALMEGVDSARVLRGLAAGHPAPERPPKARLARAAAIAIGLAFVPLNYAVTAALNRGRKEWTIGTVTLDRRDLKQAATSLGIQQRSLIYGLIMCGFYDPAGRSTKNRTIGYSNLPPRRADGDDPYVRLQMRTTRMRHRQSFSEYLRQLDRQLSLAGRGASWTQLQNDAFFGIHRRIARLLPFLYQRRFFGYVPYDFLLSLVPPHLPGTGSFEHFGFNDVYCGSHAAGVNCCVIVPQRDRVSLNIYCPTRDLGRTRDITELAAAVGVSTMPAAPTARLAMRARSASEA